MNNYPGINIPINDPENFNAVYWKIIQHLCLLGVSDEMYQVIVYMPEDVPFNCRVCCPQHPSPWETFVRQDMCNGMNAVLDALLSSHSSILLQPITHPVSTSHCKLCFRVAIGLQCSSAKEVGNFCSQLELEFFNPLDSKGNYGATSTNTKLIHWLLIGGLLHLVQ